MRSLRDDDLGAICDDEAVDAAELGAMRDVFIAAGAERLRDVVGGATRWRQVGLQFDALGMQWSLFVGGDFQDNVREGIAKGAIEQFAFIHKPPGMRLRWLQRRGAESLVEDLLDQCLARGEITGWSRGIYDAEAHQFGGPPGLELAHRFFTVESLASLAYHRIRLRGQASLDAVRFSLLLVDLTLREMTGDAWERWDVWTKMSLAGRAPAVQECLFDGSQTARADLEWLLANWETEVGGSERLIIEEFRSALPALAATIVKPGFSASLLWPWREILPYWIVFHWNRMTFDIGQQRRMTFLMTTILSPHGE